MQRKLTALSLMLVIIAGLAISVAILYSNHNRSIPVEPPQSREVLATTTQIPMKQYPPHVLTLTIQLSKSGVALGENLEVTFTLKNTWSQAVTLLYSPRRLFDLAVYDSDGNLLGFWSSGRAFPMAPVRTLILQPGQSYVETLTWDLRLKIGQAPLSPLSTGLYQIRGILVPAGIRQPLPQLTAESEPVWLAIKSPGMSINHG